MKEKIPRVMGNQIFYSHFDLQHNLDVNEKRWSLKDNKHGVYWAFRKILYIY